MVVAIRVSVPSSHPHTERPTPSFGVGRFSYQEDDMGVITWSFAGSSGRVISPARHDPKPVADRDRGKRDLRVVEELDGERRVERTRLDKSKHQLDGC